MSAAYWQKDERPKRRTRDRAELPCNTSMQIRYEVSGQRPARGQQLASGGATSHKRADALREPEAGGTPRGIHTCKKRRSKARRRKQTERRKEKKATIGGCRYDCEGGSCIENVCVCGCEVLECVVITARPQRQRTGAAPLSRGVDALPG